MKKALIIIVLAAAGACLLSCRKNTGLSPEPVIFSSGMPVTKGEAYGRDTVITFNIIDDYPAYFAQASSAVPCDVLVFDRHDNAYPICKGQTFSEKQWDILDIGQAPGKRECDVAVIICSDTGEKFEATVEGIRYEFRIGSYDD